MRIRIAMVSALLLGALAVGAQTPTVAVRTMRVDYFHTGVFSEEFGNTTQELFALDEVVIEPAAWPGSPGRCRRPAAARRLRLRRARRRHQRVLYSRGFGSIYDEWVTTEEAATITRTFHESLRFPAPAAPVHRERPQARRRQPVEGRVDDDRRPEGHVRRTRPRRIQAPATLIAIERHGDPAPQGGPAAARRRLHRGRTRQVREPTRSGWSTCSSPPRPSRSAARTSTCGASCRRRASRASRGRRSACTRQPGGRHLRRVRLRALRADVRQPRVPTPGVVRALRRRGDRGQRPHLRRRRHLGLYSTVAADNAFAPYVFVHEFGHHFAALADEYYTSPVAYLPSADARGAVGAERDRAARPRAR